jgi:hypothetical protein
MRILAVLGLSALMFCTGCTRTTAVRQCRADLQKFTQEADSYDAEYSLYGPTVVSQRSMNELMDQEQQLVGCMNTDSGNQEQYKAGLSRLGFVDT